MADSSRLPVGSAGCAKVARGRGRGAVGLGVSDCGRSRIRCRPRAGGLHNLPLPPSPFGAGAVGARHAAVNQRVELARSQSSRRGPAPVDRTRRAHQPSRPVLSASTDHIASTLAGSRPPGSALWRRSGANELQGFGHVGGHKSFHSRCCSETGRGRQRQRRVGGRRLNPGRLRQLDHVGGDDPRR